MEKNKKSLTNFRIRVSFPALRSFTKAKIYGYAVNLNANRQEGEMRNEFDWFRRDCRASASKRR